MAVSLRAIQIPVGMPIKVQKNTDVSSDTDAVRVQSNRQKFRVDIRARPEPIRTIAPERGVVRLSEPIGTCSGKVREGKEAAFDVRFGHDISNLLLNEPLRSSERPLETCHTLLAENADELE